MNYYEQAIEILSKKPDTDRLIFEIAKKKPKTIVDAYERIHGPMIDTQIINMAKAGSSRIDCIKKYRQLTGVGLQEAKKHVEAIYNFSGNNILGTRGGKLP